MKALTEANFLLYAAANYNNLECYSTDELYEDLNTFTYLKKLFTRYHDKNELKERLIVNHLIKLYNIFNSDAATRMLFYKIDRAHWHYLKTFLLFMSFMPDYVYRIGETDETIISSSLPIDIFIVKQLRKL